jgi:superfamily II RNA helicase
MVVICNNNFEDNNYNKYFEQYPYDLSNFQKWALYSIINGHHTLVTAHTGSGKCLKYDTDILMFDGTIKKVQDIKVGEKLMGDDSNERNVLGLARGIESMYNIILSDGDSFTCNESHILSLKYNVKPFIKDNKNSNRYELIWFDNVEIKMRYQSFNYKNKDKEDCFIQAQRLLNEKKLTQGNDYNISVKDFLNLPKYLQRNSLSYKVGIEFPEKNIDIDPYIIGLWLGDGSSHSAEITCQDAVILKYLHEKILEYDCYLQYRNGYTYGLTTLKKYTNRGRENIITTVLRNYNLLNNKHIPNDYKINSRENRLKLLAGLIDSDGYYHCKTYEITQKNNLLTEDIVYLVKSLGFACSCKKVKKSCYYNNIKKEGEYNRIHISGDNLTEIPVLCKRKKCNEERIINKPALEYHFKIKSEGIGNYYGFEIDGNHKFVLGNFIVTHNTQPAEFAIDFFKEKNKKVIYTGPIKALCNQKYYDFKKKFPHISFGILTGDIKDNPEADVLIMTTEILRNTLFSSLISKNNDKNINLHFEMDFNNELGAVVFDEVHYIGDADRGNVWEQSIILLPPHVQLIMLSATIEKPEIFANWIEKEKNKTYDNIEKKLYLCPTNERVVPLTHYGWISTNKSIFKIAKNTEYEKKLKEYVNKPIKLADNNGVFNELNYYAISDILNYFYKNRNFVKRHFVLNDIIKYLNNNNMLPAICFIFSRKNVELCAHEIEVSLFEEGDKTPSIIKKECENILRSKIKNYKEYTQLDEFKNLITLLQKGIAIHHAGIMPILREMVEMLFEKGYIKLLFATETFAVGINMPTKTVIFTSLSKFNGDNGLRYLLSHEYTQMAGRAGRRGLDKIGHVIHCNNLFDMPLSNEYKKIVTGSPKMLKSQFKISFNLVLNVIASNKNIENNSENNSNDYDFNKLKEFMEKSFIQTDIIKEINNYNKELDVLDNKIDELRKGIDSGIIFITKKEIIETYKRLLDSVKNASQKQKKKIQREISEVEQENKFLKKDMEKYNEYNDLCEERNKTNNFAINAVNYIDTNIQLIINILKNDNFIDISYNLNDKAFISMQLQEVNSLAMADTYIKYNGFSDISTQELVGIFSCFTNISLQDDKRNVNPSKKNNNIYEVSKYIVERIEYYKDQEIKNNLFTGLEYEYNFDLIEYVFEWCNCSNECECKYIIDLMKCETEIFLGEFIKAILKINNIALELEKICETLQNMDLLKKLREIPELTLKYIATNQSLYI